MTGKPFAAKKFHKIRQFFLGIDPQEPLRIMLIGKSGAGKSSSGNTILNKTVFKSDMKLKRVTIYCEKEDGRVEDRRVSIIDTPGLFEEGRDKDEKDEIIREILMRVKLQQPGPHVFVFVIPLGRMTQADQDTKKLIEAKFGPNVWDYTIVLFTHGDRPEGKTINDVITESDNDLRDFVRKCSGGFHVFNNKHPEDKTQVTRLIEKIETLVALNGGGHYRTEFYPWEERKIRREQERILAKRENFIKRMDDEGRDYGCIIELPLRSKEGWRNAEESSRIEAEAISRRNAVLGYLVPFVLFLFLVWVFRQPQKCLSAATLPTFTVVSLSFYKLQRGFFRGSQTGTLGNYRWDKQHLPATMTGKPFAAKKLDNSPMKEENAPQEPLRIMLIGKSGAGKSSSGNTILNKTVFKSDMKLKRVTIYCEKEDGMVEDRRVSIIDTPGLFEEGRSKDEIVREILMRVKLQEPGPHVFVLVIPLGRMTQEDQDTNKLIEAKFGPNVWDYTIVLFTHGDRLEGRTINDVITESDNNLRDFVRKCSGGFHVFDNKHPEDQTQVTRFIEKIQTLVSLNGGGHYRTEFYPREEREIREEQERILTEESDSIKKKEDDLKKNVKGEELNMKLKVLWRKEEESSRKAAERQIIRRNFIWKGLFCGVPLFLFLLVVVVWFLSPAKHDLNQSASEVNN
ncbi:uncharacterized protein LOC133421560 [Cololabis saira]|uniref:uncharacterized protein LOC133421560 n=1 Tax=Cololabis saira TaxID=129043 RepID=UPI002AD4C3C0|nr:uncharacterized protein LOC133421560 [Cololabis saira]